MKRLLISTAAVALMSGVGVAADLPVYEPPPPMVEPTPIASNWTGFYIGIHGGYGWADADIDDDDFDFDFDDDGDDDFFGDAELEGPVIGGQVGVNWQFNNFVLGVEGDGSWSGIDDDEDTFDDDDDIGISAEVDWLASARGRVGLAWDRFMIYGTGGVAFAEFSTDLEDDGDLFDDEDDDDDGETEIGWVAGGGAEFMATDNVTLGVEYLHYSFDEIDAPSFASATDTFEPEGDADIDVIRGRVNVKFGSLFGG
jgi:outer membrane immunogenic protein